MKNIREQLNECNAARGVTTTIPSLDSLLSGGNTSLTNQGASVTSASNAGAPGNSGAQFVNITG